MLTVFNVFIVDTELMAGNISRSPLSKSFRRNASAFGGNPRPGGGPALRNAVSIANNEAGVSKCGGGLPPKLPGGSVLVPPSNDAPRPGGTLKPLRPLSVLLRSVLP